MSEIILVNRIKNPKNPRNIPSSRYCDLNLELILYKKTRIWALKVFDQYTEL